MFSINFHISFWSIRFWWFFGGRFFAIFCAFLIFWGRKFLQYFFTVPVPFLNFAPLPDNKMFGKRSWDSGLPQEVHQLFYSCRAYFCWCGFSKTQKSSAQNKQTLISFSNVVFLAKTVPLKSQLHNQLDFKRFWQTCPNLQNTNLNKHIHKNIKISFQKFSNGALWAT